MRLLAALLLLSTSVAGCAGDAKSSDDPSDDETFADIDFEATETTGVVRGLVVDQAIRPVEGAHVSLTPGNQKTDTNPAGAFGFGDLEPGTYFLRVSKLGFTSAQSTVEVVAGVKEPKIARILIEANPDETPYVQVFSHEGFITCGAAIIATSVGCTTFTPVADALGDEYIWNVLFDSQPQWAQGELIWDQTQPAGGMLIWEIVVGGSNSPVGYRETTTSPALAYWDEPTITEHWDAVSERGINFRVFGGPHPLCTPIFFGCGLTINQDFQAIMHVFYNFIPDEGWRYTVDGDPEYPE